MHIIIVTFACGIEAETKFFKHPCDHTVSHDQAAYRICGIFGGDFNLAVWRFFVRLPNLNDANIAS